MASARRRFFPATGVYGLVLGVCGLVAPQIAARFGAELAWRRSGWSASFPVALSSLKHAETHDDKVQNTIATAGILGVGVTIINAVLAAKLWGVDFESGGEVFAAGALPRFDAWR